MLKRSISLRVIIIAVLLGLGVFFIAYTYFSITEPTADKTTESAEAARSAAESERAAAATRAAEAERIAAAQRAAEAERVAAAERVAEAGRAEAVERAVEAERIAAAERAAEAERAAAASAAAAAAAAKKAAEITIDSLYFGGDIITMEGDIPQNVEAVGVKNGKIVFVGTRDAALKYQNDETNLINLKGKTMMPGFIEPHLDPAAATIMLSNDIIAPYDWVLPDGVTPGVIGHDAFVAQLKALIAANAVKNKVYFVWGYHPLWHGELSRALLTQISPEQPVAIIHRSSREIFLNDAAIKSFAIKEADFKDNPQVDWARGHFFDAGWQALLPKISPDLLNPDAYKKGLRVISQLALKNGITTIAETGFSGANAEMEYDLLKQEMATKPPYHLYLIPNGIPRNAEGRSIAKMPAAIAMLPGKYDIENLSVLPKQILLPAGEHFARQFDVYRKAGYSIHVPAEGESAVLPQFSESGPHVTLIHTGNFTDKQAKQMANLGMSASINPYYQWALDKKTVQFNNLISNNIPVAFHSSLPLAPLEPLTLVWASLSREASEQSVFSEDQIITPYMALKAITITAAQTLGLDNEIGTIKPGKKANFTLLKQNPLIVTPKQIRDIPVWGTIFEGKITVVKQKSVLRKLETRVLYFERRMLPPGAELTVTFSADPEKGKNAEVITQKTVSVSGAPPYNISLDYDAGRLQKGVHYVLKAQIEVGGQLFFTNNQPVNVFDENRGKMVEIILDNVAVKKTEAEPEKAAGLNSE